MRDHGRVSTAYDVRVTGRVQGVFFRSFVEQEAARLGVHGWVRNEPDGSVAGHFEGPEDAVTALVDRCRTGPPAARVEHVDVREATASGESGFRVRY